MKQIPATIISGFEGAGKTTLLRSLVGALEGKKVAVIVSALGPGDVDSGLCESDTRDGSIRCANREHLGMELRKAGRARTWDHILVESTAFSEPLPVAEVFVLDDGRGTRVSYYTRIDAMITVVDASRFWGDLASSDTLVGRGLADKPGDQRRVAEVLVAQVELADVLCITRAEESGPEHLARLDALLRRLNPRARILIVSKDFDAAALLDTGLFDFDAARAATSPARLCDAPAAPAEHGFASFGYRRYRPFHPQRFEALVHGDWEGVLRSKGTFWVADRPDAAGEWSQAGKSLHHVWAGSFWAATPEAEWPVGDEQKARIKALFREPYGDRRQELMFVVGGLTREALESRLDACLLTDAELALGPAGWTTFGGAAAAGDPGHAHGHDHAHDHDHDHGAHDHNHDRPRFVGHTPQGGHHSN